MMKTPWETVIRRTPTWLITIYCCVASVFIPVSAFRREWAMVAVSITICVGLLIWLGTRAQDEDIEVKR